MLFICRNNIVIIAHEFMSVLVSLMKLNYVKIFVKCEKQGVKLTPLYSKLITKVSLKHFNYWGMMGVFFIMF